MKRPRKSRFEVDFAGKTAVQVYDGQHGWKLRPYLNRDDVEAFTADEAKSEASKADLEGPLVDYAAKGTQIALEGIEPVDGHNAYKLKLTLKERQRAAHLDRRAEFSRRESRWKPRAAWTARCAAYGSPSAISDRCRA